MKKTVLFFITILLTLPACQSTSFRTPASFVTSQERAELKDLKQRKVELDALSIHFQKKKNADQLKKITDEQKSISKKIHEIESIMTSNEVNNLKKVL